MTDGNKPSPGKAFLLGLVAPGLGYHYAGNGRKAFSILSFAIVFAGLGVALSLLPPFNLVALLLMILPALSLIALSVAAGIGAAIETSLRNQAETAPGGDAKPAGVRVGLAVYFLMLAAYAAFLVISPNIGTITTPNDDMAPATLEGDFVVTWKDYYRDRLPERGDVAVVKLPGVEGDRIMRIVGLPGDSLLGVLGVLTINGQAVGRSADGDFAWRDAGGTHRNASRYIESLPGGASYAILQSAEGMFRGTLLGANLRIPDGHYFVIGDNRDNSKSSWDFGMLPGLVLGDRPTVILSSSLSSLIGKSVQP